MVMIQNKSTIVAVYLIYQERIGEYMRQGESAHARLADKRLWLGPFSLSINELVSFILCSYNYPQRQPESLPQIGLNVFVYNYSR